MNDAGLTSDDRIDAEDEDDAASPPPDEEFFPAKLALNPVA